MLPVGTANIFKWRQTCQSTRMLPLTIHGGTCWTNRVNYKNDVQDVRLLSQCGYYNDGRRRRVALVGDVGRRGLVWPERAVSRPR